jgi:CubicO group peptidase (beta-lactamase class C family)
VSALEEIEGWPVPQAGVAVVGPEGVRAVRGETRSPLRIASVSKVLTAYAVLIGVEEGAVELDDPAGPPGATLRHLLAHTAGYGFDSDAAVFAQPGTRRIYSNRGIEEAARHLERAAGMPFAQYLREAVLDTLGMVESDPTGSPAFGIHSTVEDLARFAVEVLDPKLLARATVDEAFTVQFPGLTGVVPGVGRFDPCDWGLGFERNFGRPGHWAGSSVSPLTGGHFGGAGTFLWVDPVRRLAAVALTGRDFGPWAMEVWPPFCDAVVAEFS